MNKSTIFKYNFNPKTIFTLMIFCFIAVSSCDNSTAQQKNQQLKKTGNNKPLNANSMVAPDFSLADLDGNTITLQQMKGKVVLLNFWGTWCGPCRKEIPDFINLSKKYKKDGLEIVGITLTSGPPENIKAFADKWGINYKLLTDIKGNETQTITALYGQATGKRITGIPTTFIIDREGDIQKRYVGPRSEAIFYNDLKKYLKNNNPKIGILNIGTENNKGLEFLQEASELISNSFLKNNYIGFIEPNKVISGDCDIIVSDGYTGNIMLKSAEGISDLITSNLKKMFNKSLLNKISYKLIEKDLKILKNQVNPEIYNGATLIAYPVFDPERYAVIEIEKNGKVLSIEEKPINPKTIFCLNRESRLVLRTGGAIFFRTGFFLEQEI